MGTYRRQSTCQGQALDGTVSGSGVLSWAGFCLLLVSFQKVKTWKRSKDPDYAVKKARVEHLYAIADG